MKSNRCNLIITLISIALSSGCASGGAPASPIATTRPAIQQVAIDNFSFVPQQLTITAGATVTWVNHDDIPHTATSDLTPAVFDSGVLDTDQSFSFTFNTPGVYRYFCKVHPHMTGIVTVLK